MKSAAITCFYLFYLIQSWLEQAFLLPYIRYPQLIPEYFEICYTSLESSLVASIAKKAHSLAR